MTAVAHEMEIASELVGDDSYHEALRVFVGEEAFIQLRDIFGPNTNNWGMLLADVAIHIARMKLESDDVPIADTLNEIEDGYRGRMADQTNVQHRTLTGRN